MEIPNFFASSYIIKFLVVSLFLMSYRDPNRKVSVWETQIPSKNTLQ